MPKIQGIKSVVGIQGSMSSRRATAEDFGGDRGLGRLGRAVGDVTSVIHEQNQKREIFEAQKMAAKEAADMHLWMKEAKKKAPPGAKDFTKDIVSLLNKRKEKMIESAGSTASRRFIELRVSETHTGIVKEASRFEARSHGKQQATVLKEIFQKNENIVRADPEKLEGNLFNEEELIGSFPFGDKQTKTGMLSERRTILWDSAIDGTVTAAETDPAATTEQVEALIEGLKSEDKGWVKNNSPRAYDNAITRLAKLQNHIAAKEQSQYFLDFDDEMKRIEITGTDEKGRFTEKEIRSVVFDPIRQEKMVKRQKRSRAIGEQVSFIKDASEEEIVEQINQLQSGLPSTEEPGKDISAVQALVHGFKRRIQVYRQDPVAYTHSVSEQVSNSYKEYQEVKSAEGATPQDKEKARDHYVGILIAEQEKLSKRSQPKILTRTEIGVVASQMAEIDKNPAGAAEAVEFLKGIEHEWGSKHWPLVASELRSAKAISGIQYVAATALNNPEQKHLSEELMMASKIKLSELAKQIPDQTAKRVATELGIAVLEPFRQTVDSLVNGQEIYKDRLDTVVTYAMFKAARGEDLEEAVEEISEQMNKDYEFFDNYRVPVNQDISGVQDGVRAIKQDISNFNFVLPNDLANLKDVDAQKRYATALSDNGRFVTTGDESGLRFVDQFNNEVSVWQGGEIVPLRWTWGDLQSIEPQPTPVFHKGISFDPVGKPKSTLPKTEKKPLQQTGGGIPR